MIPPMMCNIEKLELRCAREYATRIAARNFQKNSKTYKGS